MLRSEHERNLISLYIAFWSCHCIYALKPALSSIPYAVRLRQCLVEYNSPNNDSRRPLFNALKYASSFPVIYLSAAQRIVVSDMMALKGEGAAQETWHGEHQLFRLWCALAHPPSILISFSTTL